MKRALDLLEKVLEAACVAALIVVVIAVSWQVIARYVTEASTAWAPELAQIAFVWCALLAIPVGVRRGRHMMIDVWTGIKNKTVQAAISTFAMIVVVGVSGTLVYFGINMLPVALSRTLPGLGISAGIANIAVPVGFTLCAIFAIESWWGELHGKKHKTELEAAVEGSAA